MALLTLGVRRALRAVAQGNAVRIYRANGNVLKADGISSHALWQLSKAKYIEDGPQCTGELEQRCVLVLTELGRSAHSNRTP